MSRARGTGTVTITGDDVVVRGGLGQRESHLVAVLRAAALVVGEVAALVLLVRLGAVERYRVDWGNFSYWLQTSPVEDAVVGLLRWLALALVVWLLASSVLYTLARLSRVPALVRGAEWLTVPVVRHVVERALAVTVAASTVVGARGAPPAWAHAASSSPATVQMLETAPASGPRAAQRADAVDAGGVVVTAPPTPAGAPVSPPPLPAPAPGPVVELAPAAEVEVSRGDHLWGIAAARLAGVTGRPENELRAADVAPYWRQVVEANRGRLHSGHPGLIYAGERVVLPPVLAPAPPASPAPPPPVAPPSPSRATLPAAEVVAPAGRPEASPDAPGDVAAAAPSSTSPPTALGEGQRAPSTPAPHAPSLAERIGWVGGAVLAAGVLEVGRRLRRRHGEERARRRPPGSAVHLDLALRTTEGLDDVAWAAATLRQLTAELPVSSGGSFPDPRLVEVSSDGLEVVWEEPRPRPLDGWTTLNGGWSWYRGRSAEPLAAPTAPAPCPALVTIGTREGRVVLLNLEAVGLLSVSGPPASDVVRAMCLELGSTPFADVVTVLLCGFPVDGVEHLERVVTVDMDDVLAWLRDRARSSSHELDRRRVTSTFAGRVSAKGFEPFEPVVVVVAADRLDATGLEELKALTHRGSGAAVVVVAPSEAVGEWSLRVEGDRGVLEPLGLSVSVAPVSPPVAAQLAVLLDDAAGAEGPLAASPYGEADDDGAVFAEASAGLLDPEAAAIAGCVDDEDGYRDPPFDVEVRVLGQVEVVGAALPLTPAEAELLTYLATHRHGDTADTIVTMVYPEGASTKTFHNRVTALRKKLGKGRDGQLLVPAVTDSRYRVSPRVLTDWDRFLARVRHAEKEPSGEATELLREALELVGGPPFRAAHGHSWAHSEGAAGEIEQTVKLAARRLAELYLEAGDPSGALWAACRGRLAADTLADAQRLVAMKMRAHVELGNAAAAVGAYRELLADLADVDPGLDPDPEVLELYRSITGARRDR